MQAIFRKYDLRGIVGKDFEVQDSYQITRSILTLLLQKSPKIQTIAVGMDGRNSSLVIKNEVCRAITDHGLNAKFIGLCPTPALYFACHTLTVDAGIMITASHNPKEYNGFKLVLGQESIWGDDINQIAKICASQTFAIPTNLKGMYSEIDIIEPYVDWLACQFKHLSNNQINAVIDCGNGTGGTVIPKLIEKLNWPNVTVLYSEVDGNYPHHNPDPVEFENMLDVRTFLQNNPMATFGAGLDGDCDRMAIMTKSGQLVPSDQLLGIFALNLDRQKQPGVVVDIKCSDAIVSTLRQAGIPCHISPTGHAYIKSYMKQHHATLGGELSGHFCFKDRHFGFDDGIYALLRFCELITESGQSIDQFLKYFPQTFCSPEYRIPCHDNQKDLIVQSAYLNCSSWPNTEIIAIDGIRIQTKIGWAVVRAANTEPALSIRIEGYSEEGLQKLKLDLFGILAQHLNPSVLATKMDLKI